MHVAWSGNHVTYAERLSGGAAVLGGGRAAAARRGRARRRARATPTPWVYGAHGRGLDALAARFHRYLRSRPQHPRQPAPGRAEHLGGGVLRPRPRPADRAGPARRGGRRRALRPRRRLVPAPARRHRGAGRLVRRRGRVARRPAPAGRRASAGSAWSSACGSSRRWSTSTPTWPARTPTGSWAPAAATPLSSRHQQVLDLAHPDAYAYILERLDALLDEYPIGYLKWDHNRDLIEAGRSPDGHARRARADPRGLPAARRAARPAPRAGDRVVLVGRRPGRPGGAGAHRPGLGQRLHRRAGAPADPALDRAAAAARAGRQPRRRARVAHHRPHARPVVPGRHRAVRLVRHRVGPDRGASTSSARSWPSWVALYKELRELLHTGDGRARAAARPVASRCTAWSRRTGPRRCSRWSSWPPRRPRCPARCGCPGSTPRAATACRRRPPATCPTACGASTRRLAHRRRHAARLGARVRRPARPRPASRAAAVAARRRRRPPGRRRG